MSDSKSNHSGGRKRADSHLRATVLAVLLLAAGWSWYYAHATALAVLGVVVLMVLMQWINERSKRR